MNDPMTNHIEYTTPPAKVSDGYVLVPVEATQEMLEQGAHWVDRALAGIDTDSEESADNVWTAMLAAAPEPGEGE